MRRLLREPLLHFLLLGAVLFGLDAYLRDGAAGASGGEIVVSRGRIENLAALFAKTWQRAPTPEELRDLVEDHVYEEALYREGMAMGVDQGDTVIRRRVRQKMEFVVDDVAEQVEPSEADLAAWLAAHPADYASPERFRFRQVFLSSERRGDALAGDAEALLEVLRSKLDGDPRELGDRSLLEHAYPDASADTVAETFGPAFAEGLEELPTGEWSGPLESPYGLHLVFVDARTAGRIPALAEVRSQVERDWDYAQREVARSRFREEILARYRVTIEWPDPAGLEAEASE